MRHCMTLQSPIRLLWSLLLCGALDGRAQEVLPGTQPLALQGDLSAQMVAGIGRFLTHETELAIGERQQYWHRDFSSAEAYDKSVGPNRERLREILPPAHEVGRDRTRSVQGGAVPALGKLSGGSPPAPSDRLRRSVSPDFAGERGGGPPPIHSVKDPTPEAPPCNRRAIGAVRQG